MMQQVQLLQRERLLKICFLLPIIHWRVRRHIARGDSTVDKKIEIEGHTFPDSVAEPVYPYNKVYQSESGHVIEIDDTVGKERLSQYHRSGTFQEVHPDGSVVQRIVNDNYQVVAKDDKIYILVDLTVERKRDNQC